ncbi:hypothetical protein SY86_10075 [Erwinia tracheiphila]|uniref:Uncharacterized protein n=1 Tax=Erwinia tracheiphila TaxID=65700 RepID=A0A0M2K8H4_9GAMM|nr:hypothetical protein SY86_10075 [Erwinia tracheiphila]
MSVTSYSMSFIALRADDINFSHMLHPKRKAYVISKSASRPELQNERLKLICTTIFITGRKLIKLAFKA